MFDAVYRKGKANLSTQVLFRDREAEWKSAQGLALIAASEDMNSYQRDMLPDWIQGLPLCTNWSPSHLIFQMSPTRSDNGFQ